MDSHYYGIADDLEVSVSSRVAQTSGFYGLSGITGLRGAYIDKITLTEGIFRVQYSTGKLALRNHSGPAA